MKRKVIIWPFLILLSLKPNIITLSQPNPRRSHITASKSDQINNPKTKRIDPSLLEYSHFENDEILDSFEFEENEDILIYSYEGEASHEEKMDEEYENE